jgi:hypothetical protein
MRYLLLFFCGLILLLSGCKKEKETPVAVTVPIESLEDALTSVHSKQELVNFLTQHPVLRDYFLGRKNYPNDSVFINTLYKRFTNPHFDTLLMETHRVFGDGAQLKAEFEEAFGHVKANYPDFKIPKIKTAVSGLQDGSDLFVSDSLIIIGLDYYLGAKAKYRPNMYAYLLRRYNKDFIVPSVMLLYGIDARFNKTNLSDQSVLADMIAYGKAYYFASHMLPSVADSVFIGYSGKEWNTAEANEGTIYKHLVDKEVMYATSHQVKQRYLDERPNTLEIAQNCPGRIGAWVGWQIVNSYAAQNSGRSIVEVMNDASAQKIFKDSHYRPEKN